MPRVLILDLRASMAHFRLPDTTVTHASYPFIPRTALRGLLASILGLGDLEDSSIGEGSSRVSEHSFVGLQLMSPVKSSFQKISMLGKGWAGSSTDTFNKPVSIEVIVKPHYRIYYTGPHFEVLESRVKSRQSKYHTYLGSCFCQVVPLYVDSRAATDMEELASDAITTNTVVPSFAVERIVPEAGKEYARAGGFHYKSLGNRQFHGVLNMIYEVNGRSMTVRLKEQLPTEPVVRFLKLDSGEMICLW